MLAFLSIILLLTSTISNISGVYLFDYCKYDEMNTPCATQCIRSSKCRENVVFQHLTDEERELVLDIHNRLRDEVAGGKYEDFNVPSGADINVLSYSKEIEFLAACHIQECDFNHDAKRITADGERVGQNLYAFGSTIKTTMDRVFFERGIQAWFDEYKLIKDNSVLGPYTGRKDEILHFTQMIWAKTLYIGCAKMHFDKYDWENYYLFCNYGPAGNWEGEQAYTFGDPACSVQNNEYKNLCGNIRPLAQDDYNPPIDLNDPEDIYRTKVKIYAPVNRGKGCHDDANDINNNNITRSNNGAVQNIASYIFIICFVFVKLTRF